MHTFEHTPMGSGQHPLEMSEVLFKQHGEPEAVCPACLRELFVLPSKPGDMRQMRYFCHDCDVRYTPHAEG